jgi:MFS family permease
VVAGLRAVSENRGVRLLVLFLVAHCIVIGAFEVIAVILAFDLLDLGESGVGYLNAALGAGGMVGAAATLTLIGRRHLMPPLLLGAAGLGAAFILLAAYPTVAGAFGLLALAGAGSMLVEVAGRTLLQRLAPAELLARVFALYESLSQFSLALGAILVPALVALGGAEAALVAAGAFLPLLILLRFRALRAIDEEATVPIVEISLLRSMPIFAPLPPPEIEGLAHSLSPVEIERGTVIMREGEPGDRFYAIADGEVEISSDGEPFAIRNRGDCLGEISLLLDVPRTATVTAATDVLLYALEREPFLATITGHAAASHAADVIVKERVA